MPEATVTADSGPAPDPSERAAALVRAAVSKPTVLPTIYVIPENIGDRISRLAGPKATTPIIIPPKIPQPDPNWTPTNTVPTQYIELDWRDLLDKAHIDASAPGEVTFVEPPQSEETPQEVLEASAHTSVAEPPQLEETPQEVPEAQASTSVAEPPQLEETPQEVPEAQASTPVAEPLQLEETPQEVPEAQASTPVAEPLQLEETPQEVPEAQASTPVAEPPQLEETPQEVPEAQASTPVAEPLQLEEEKKETRNIHCPSCDSTDNKKNGHSNGKQKYVCKNCGKHFVVSDSLAQNQDKLETKTNSPVKTPEVKEPQSLTGVSDSTSKSSMSQSKTKKKAKGFGAKKAKK